MTLETDWKLSTPYLSDISATDGHTADALTSRRSLKRQVGHDVSLDRRFHWQEPTEHKNVCCGGYQLQNGGK